MDKESHKYAQPIRSVSLDRMPDPVVPKEPALETLAGRVLMVLGLVGVFAAVGGFDYADQVAAQAKAKQERAARIAAYADFHRDAQARLSYPCMATIRDGMTSVTMGPERCVRVKESK